MELEIEKFSPTKAELISIVETSKYLSLPDPFDRQQVVRIKNARLELRNKRTSISKLGKELRESALTFQRAVIAKEKELIEIIEPEELRLAALEDESKRAYERKERMELLPHRRERLAAIADNIEATDEQLLDMDGPTFEAYFNQRQAEKNAADQRALEEREASIRAEEERQQREKQQREREEQARKDEREKFERQQKEEAERKAHEAEEHQRKEQEAQAALEREARYKAFLASCGWTRETASDFIISRSTTDVKLYKIVGTFEIK